MTRDTNLPAPIGEIFQARREELGINLEQAEEATRIRRRYLEALEDDRFDDLPGEVYVRGFLRIYADYLGLNPEELLAWYQPMRRPTPADLTTPPRLDRTRASIGGRLLAIGLIAVIALAAIYLYQQQQQLTSPAAAPAPTRPPAQILATAPAPIATAPPPTPEPTATPPSTPTPLARSVNVRVDILGPTGLDVYVDGKLEHSATLQEGDRVAWRGESVRIVAADAGFVVLTVDGRHLGIFGPRGQRKEYEWLSPFRATEGTVTPAPTEPTARPAGSPTPGR